MLTNAHSVEGLCPAQGSTSSAAIATGVTTTEMNAMEWERLQAENQAEGSTCRSQCILTYLSRTKRRWTSWQPLTSGSFRPNEVAVWSRLRVCGSREALSAPGLYHSFFLSFPFCLSVIIHLSAEVKGRGSGALPSSRLAQRWRGYQGPVIL